VSGVWGPVAGAGIALIGVVIGLAVTGRRERDKFLLAREDAYRGSMRDKIASLMVVAKRFDRNGYVL
jgi:hypothetical protein